MSVFVQVAWPAASSGISFVSSAVGGSSVSSMPTHQSGDLLVAFAYRDNSDTSPGLGSGWTSITTLNSEANGPGSFRVGKLLATGSNMTSGTWSNATDMLILCYRGSDNHGGYTMKGGTNNSFIIEAVTMDVSDGSSWIVGVAAHKNKATSFDDDLTEGGRTMPNRVRRVGTNDVIAAWDTSGGVSSWERLTHTLTGDTGWWGSCALEITAAA